MMKTISRAKFFNSMLNPGNPLQIERFGRTRVPGSWRLRDRVVPEHYLSMIVEDTAWVEIKGKRYRLAPGDLIWIQPGVKHSYGPGDSSRPHTFYHLRFELSAGDDSLRLSESHLFLSRSESLIPEMEGLFDEYTLKQEFTDIRFRSLLTAFLTLLIRVGKREATDLGFVPLRRAQRQKLQYYIEQHLSDSISSRDLASLLNLTQDYFARLFRSTYGVSPRSWLLRERMNRAAVLLSESTLNITEVAYAVGYADLFTFSRLFKQRHGRSPREYRDNFL
jgi:AraC-like DNA-binding protein/mannose-6-phosphate isomerase-like protein (cupin superfamily)